jgi:hypothetical protein
LHPSISAAKNNATCFSSHFTYEFLISFSSNLASNGFAVSFITNQETFYENIIFAQNHVSIRRRNAGAGKCRTGSTDL